MKAVYRRDPRLYYGPKKTRGWIGTFQTAVFGVPVCDPQAVLTAIEAMADESVTSGDMVMLGTQGDAVEVSTISTDAVLVGVQGEAAEIFN